VPCLRHLVAGVLPHRPGFNPRPAYVRYMVRKVALAWVFGGLQYSHQYYFTNYPYSFTYHKCPTITGTGSVK